jgi:hypothetical protein
MMNIGIEKDYNTVYEGVGHNGRVIRPTPLITPAVFVDYADENLKAHRSSSRFGYRFREDFFDPVTRVRRGRFYYNNDGQPIEWQITHQPGDPFTIQKLSLETFYGSSIWEKYIKGKRHHPIVLLGVDDRFTVWTILSVESTSTGEDLVTLKSRNSFGILPQIDEDKIPKKFLSKLNVALDRFTDEVHRSSPISVIDRARDVATLALLAHFDLEKKKAKDLGKLINKLEEQELIIAMSSAMIVARLHARAKPSEQERKELYQIREQDADLAVQCVGTILCEIGYAEWR